jgi:hypothetical protein
MWNALVGLPNWSSTTANSLWVSASRSIVFTKLLPNGLYTHVARTIG